MRLAALAGCAVLLALLAGCGNDSGTPKPPAAAAPTETPAPAPEVGAGGGRTQVAFIVPTQPDDSWKAIHAGAEKAIGELKKGPDGRPVIDLVWKVPAGGGDGQARAAATLVKDGIAAIVIGPDSADALKGVTDAAAANRVPVITVDSSFGSANCKSGIGLDDAQVGELAAKTLSLSKGGRWLVYPAPDDPAAAARATAFRAGVASSFATVLPEDQTAQAISSLSKDTGGPPLDLPVTAIFAPDEASTSKALAALEEGKLTGKVGLVGVGISPKLSAGLKSGELTALIVGDPVAAGYTAFKTAGDCIREKKVDTSVMIPAVLVTPENMKDPNVAPLLEPPADKDAGTP